MYLFYYGLCPELHNMANASVGRSLMTMEVDDAFDLCEMINENQANW